MERTIVVDYVKELIKSKSILEKIKRENYQFDDIELIYFIDQYSNNNEIKSKLLNEFKKIINDEKTLSLLETVLNYKKDNFEEFYGRFHSVWSIYNNKNDEKNVIKGIITGMYRPPVSFDFKKGDKVKVEIAGKVYEGIIIDNKYGSEMNPCRIFLNQERYIECNYEELERV